MANNKQENNSSSPDIITLPNYISETIESIDVNCINPALSINHFFAKVPTLDHIPYLFAETMITTHKGKIQINKPISSSTLCNGQFRSLMQDLAARNERLAATFAAHATINYRPATKLLLGADGPSPYSNINVLKLHQLYGLPYLSASMLKGSLRSYWILTKYDGQEEAALKDPLFRQLFGVGASDEQGLTGTLIFLDTFPTDFSFALEVQTPHYPDYYNGPKSNDNQPPPTDTQNPVPLYFICLQEAEFNIPIACRDAVLWDKQHDTICALFQELLTQYGLGAKTALGYGQGTAEEK